MIHLNFLHFIDWDSTFAIDPFALYDMSVFHLHDGTHTLYIIIRHKSKTSRFLRPFILQNHAIFHHAKLREVSSKVAERQIMWQTSHKNLSVLRISEINRRFILILVFIAVHSHVLFIFLFSLGFFFLCL